jgi:hypothetical protein
LFDGVLAPIALVGFARVGMVKSAPYAIAGDGSLPLDVSARRLGSGTC